MTELMSALMSVNPKQSLKIFFLLSVSISIKSADNERMIKRGKYTAVRGKGQKIFIRFCSLGDGYTEEDVVAVILGNDTNQELVKPQKLNLLIDIQEKIIDKGAAYERWATNFNLKSMSKSLLFLLDYKIETIEDLKVMEEKAIDKFNTLSAGIKEKESKMAEMLALKKQIFNYADTRDIYIEYRKSGYSKKFFEQNRQAITIHKAAKQAFNECGFEKIPTVKELM